MSQILFVLLFIIALCVTGCAVNSHAPRDQRKMVALTFGQSNSANFALNKYDPVRDVQAYAVGGIYVHAADPQPGADGPLGSVWSRLGDKLIEAGLYDQVVFISIGQGGTMVQQWSDDYLNRRLINTLDDLNEHGIVPTHFFWHQGESDKNAGTSKADYITHFLKVRETIRSRGFTAPIYVSHATYSNGLYSTEVYDAQTELVQNYVDLRQGPDTDTLTTPDYRYDNAHFNDKGVNAHADLWMDVLNK